MRCCSGVWQAEARYFAVDIAVEDRFLNLMDHLRALSAIVDHYQAITGLSSILLVFKLLGAFRFQPRLGLITRTLEVGVIKAVN